jgi:hypothetical protein
VNCRHHKNFVFANKPISHKYNHHTAFHRSHVVRVVMEPGPLIPFNGTFYYGGTSREAGKGKMGFFQENPLSLVNEFFMYDPFTIRTLEPGYPTMANCTPGQSTLAGHPILLQRIE